MMPDGSPCPVLGSLQASRNNCTNPEGPSTYISISIGGSFNISNCTSIKIHVNIGVMRTQALNMVELLL